MKLSVIMKGKQRDIKLAETIRESFVTQYNDEKKFEELLNNLGSNAVDKLIFRLNHTEKIDLYKDYKDLKTLGQEVIDTCNRKIFTEACLVDDARVWINNKGKYQEIVFESLYKVFRADERLKSFIEA